MNFILDVFVNNKVQIIRVYLICIIAGLLYMLEPYALGKMIDGVARKEFEYIFVLASLEILIIIFGFIRRYYDTVAFSAIYNKIVLDYIAKNEGTNKADSSASNARIEMTRDIIEFLENLIPHAINSFVTIIIGATYIITMGSMTSGAMSIIPYCVIILLTFVYLRDHLKKANRIKNTNYERQVNTISSQSMRIISSYFSRQRKIKILQAVLTAKSYALVDIFSLVLILLMVVMYSLDDSTTPGGILAYYQYAQRFTLGMGILPSVINAYLNIKDVAARLGAVNTTDH